MMVGLAFAVLVTGVGAVLSLCRRGLIIVSVVGSSPDVHPSSVFFITAVPLSWKSEVRWSIPPELVGKEG